MRLIYMLLLTLGVATVLTIAILDTHNKQQTCESTCKPVPAYAIGNHCYCLEPGHLE